MLKIDFNGFRTELVRLSARDPESFQTRFLTEIWFLTVDTPEAAEQIGFLKDPSGLVSLE